MYIEYRTQKEEIKNFCFETFTEDKQEGIKLNDIFEAYKKWCLLKDKFTVNKIGLNKTILEIYGDKVLKTRDRKARYISGIRLN